MAGKFEYKYSLIDGNNSVPPIIQLPIAATQTVLVGDLMVLSSGKIAKAGDAASRVTCVMAQNSTTQAAGTLVDVYPVMPGQVWLATADADATTHVLAARAYDINATTQTVDVGDNSSGCIVILKLGSSTTEVYVMFTAVDLA